MTEEQDASMAEKLIQLQKNNDELVIERDALKAKNTEYEQKIAERDKEVTRLKVVIADNISFADNGKKDPEPNDEGWDFHDKYKQLLADMKKKKE